MWRWPGSESAWQQRSAVLLAVAATASACGATTRDPGAGAGGEPSNGGAAGAGATPIPGGGGQSGSAAFAPPCFDAAAAPSCHDVEPGVSPVEARVLLSAAAVAPGARFTLLGDWAALLELPGAENPRVALLGISPSYDFSVTVLEVDPQNGARNLRILDLLAEESSSFPDFEDGLVALGCDEVSCHLLAANAADPVLRVLMPLSLPEGASVQGLERGYDGMICAYGSALFCLDPALRTWRVEVAPGPGRRFVAAAVGAALSDDGTLFSRLESGWISRPLAADGPLAGAHVLERGTSVTAPSGFWYMAADELSGEARCFQDPAPVWSSDFGLMLDRTGTVYHRRRSVQSREWCRSSDALPGLLAASGGYCSISTVLFAITDQALYSLLGAPVCAID